ncbi:transposable element Tc1 transposase [Trichonephila clavipes]|nr:transposable element Tc1 transposase [Trichonephila clavipes]
MVWAGIMINGRTRLHVVANGTMRGQRYIDEVLLPHVRLFRGVVGDKFVFMDDNATCHRTLAVQDCLDSEGIQRLVWPARSPDLNPIENVWDALERQVAGRNYPPTNKNPLIRALTEEWDKLPQQLLDNVVQSMVRRVECCITLHGGDIPKNLDIIEAVDTKQENYYQNQSADRVEDKINTFTSLSPKEHVKTRPKEETSADTIEEEIGSIVPVKCKKYPKENFKHYPAKSRRNTLDTR